MSKTTIFFSFIIVFFFASCGSSEEKDSQEKKNSTEMLIESKRKALEGKLRNIEEEFNAIQFQKGSAELPDGVEYSLDKLGKLLQKNTQYKLTVIGHTSSEGSDEINQKLSEARAESVVNYLTTYCNIDKKRLSFIGKGSTCLKDKKHPTAECNRRTEFVINK